MHRQRLQNQSELNVLIQTQSKINFGFWWLALALVGFFFSFWNILLWRVLTGG